MNEKEMNRLGNQLRFRLPRHSYPKLRKKQSSALTAREAAGVSLRWLAPAMACLFLALTSVYQEPGLSAGQSWHEPTRVMPAAAITYSTSPLATQRGATAMGVESMGGDFIEARLPGSSETRMIQSKSRSVQMRKFPTSRTGMI